MPTNPNSNRSQKRANSPLIQKQMASAHEGKEHAYQWMRNMPPLVLARVSTYEINPGETLDMVGDPEDNLPEGKDYHYACKFLNTVRSKVNQLLYNWQQTSRAFHEHD